MTDYTKLTNFAGKDTLEDTDPNKVIKGSEHDAEYESIETAVNSKADKASPALTGTATAVNLTASGTLNAAGTLQIGGSAITATAAELNKLDGVTATTAELNYVDGVTSNIQTQLDAKQATGAYLTGNETITLTGDATGSGATSIAVTVDMANLSGTTYAAGSGAAITSVDAASVDGKSVSVLTQAAYDALTPDANTIYFTT